MSHWLVARTQPNREGWAAENIVRQLAVPYLPRCAEKVKIGQHYETKAKLLFPGYIFVKTYDGRWRFLLGTYGISSVVMTGNAPAMVQEADILRIKACEDADGLVHLPKLMPDLYEEGGDKPRFKKGQSVRIKEGVYAGYQGIHEGCSVKEREHILLDYLGRKTRVLINTDQLEEP